jgi:hypoxanthine phosphoribosyltransferase
MKKHVTAHGLLFEELLDPHDLAARIGALGRQIQQDYQGKRPVFLCILNGSFIFAADLVRASDLECELSFVRLSSYRGTQSTGQISQLIGLDTDLRDRHVIVVEDIIDSGETLNHFLTQLAQTGAASIRLAALLLKPAALKYPLRADYLGFEIEDRFVVGYGLDCDGLCRNLPGVYQLLPSS